MIPKSNDDTDSIVDFATDVQQTSRTYKLNIAKERLADYTDELEALKQAIYLILMTERYENMIYSFNYGVELGDLVGKPMSYVLPEIKRRIEEALLQDDRINGVDSFDFETLGHGKVHINFIVHTILGDMEAEKVVNI